MEGFGFLDAMAEATLTTLMTEDVAWVMLVCGLYGGFIGLLVKGGGSYAFGRAVMRRIETKRGGLLATWGLGLVIFLDDYLNSLTVGATMKAVTDRFRTSRAMLAYVVDSTAAPLCLLVPLSSWGAYFASLLEQNGVAPEGQGLSVFINTIPYLFYPMVALLIVPLVAMGVIPLLGAMRRVEAHAESTGDLGIFEDDALAVEETARGGMSVFFLPIIAMVFFTVFPNIDLLRGVIAGILVTFVHYAVMRVMPLGELFDTCIDGVKSMVPVLAMLLTLFVLWRPTIGWSHALRDRRSVSLYDRTVVTGRGVHHRIAVVVHHGIQLGCDCHHHAHCFPIGADLRGQHPAGDGRIVLRQRLWLPCLLLFGLHCALGVGGGLSNS